MIFHRGPVGMLKGQDVGAAVTTVDQAVPGIFCRGVHLLACFGGARDGTAEIVAMSVAYVKGNDFGVLAVHVRGWIAPFGQELIVGGGEFFNGSSHQGLILREVGSVGDFWFVHISPMQPEASDNVGSGAFAGERLEHVETLIVILLFVPSDLLFAAVFILLHHPVLGGLKFQGGDVAWLTLR